MRGRAKRNADITVTVNKEGYEPQVIPLTKEIPGTGAAGFAGNVLVGGLVGMGVDAATGAAQDHKPNPVIVTLQPVAPPARRRGRQDGRRRRRADRGFKLLMAADIGGIGRAVPSGPGQAAGDHNPCPPL